MSSSNVLKFKNIDPSAFQSINEYKERLQSTKREFVDEVSEFVMEQTIACIQSFGILTHPHKINSKDLIMIETAVHSALCRYYELEHPMHELTDDVVSLEEDETESEDI